MDSRNRYVYAVYYIATFDWKESTGMMLITRPNPVISFADIISLAETVTEQKYATKAFVTNFILLRKPYKRYHLK